MMEKLVNNKPPITFSPGLRTDDPWAEFWMRQVTIRLRREICWCRHERSLTPDGSMGMLPPFQEKASVSLSLSRYQDEKERFFQNDSTARYLTEQLAAPSADADLKRIPASFRWIIERLRLDDTATFVLALGLAAAFDNAVGSVIASCLNDPMKCYPNLALAQKLWSRPEQVSDLADPTHILFRYGLMRRIGHPAAQYATVDWDAPIVVPPILARQLLFPSRPLPEALSPLGVPDDGAGAALENIDLTARRIASAMHDRLCLVPLRAPKGASHVEVVRSICRAIGREVFEYTGDAGANADESGLSSFATLCWLKKADMFLGYDVVCSLGSDSGAIDFQKLPLPSIPIIIFLGITDRQQLTRIPGTFLQPIVDIPGLSYQERVTHWKRELSERTAGLEDAIAECARRFRYEKNTISAICAGLKKQPGEISRPSVIQACRHELELDLGELAQKVIPRFEHEELILPHKQQVQFEELVRAMESLAEVHYDWGTAKAWNEAGISALFAGPPGTGKTMAAEILAERLHLPLYRIDLSQVVNKYIGETEKNLKRVFDVCDITDVILFFDEADSLFGKRTEVKDAHDRYANLEISYLLDRMERFKGLAILATNRKKDLDEAFLRRLRFIIDFSLPEIRQRYRIWRQVIPSTVDDSELDFDFLAGQFPLVGGHIRSIVFNACLQSAGDSTTGKDSSVRKLTMEQVIIAVKREYDKLNRSISLEHFGPYAAVVKKLES